MSTRKILLSVLALSGSVLLLNACHDDDAAAALGPKSTTAIADEQITANTSDSALPIAINDLPTVDQDASDSALPIAI